MARTVALIVALITISLTSGAVFAELPVSPGGPVGEITEEPSENTVYSWAPGYGTATVLAQALFHLGTVHPNQIMSGPSDLANIDQTGIGYTLNGDGTIDITVKAWGRSPSGYPVNLNVWIDWDGDKTFEAGEQVIDSGGYLPPGFNEFTWSGIPVPAGAASPTYLRAAIGYTDPKENFPNCPTDPGPTSTWCFGDVEDYLIPTTTTPTEEIPEFPTVVIPAAVSLFGYLSLRLKRKE